MHLPEICKGRINFQATAPPPSWSALQQCRQAWPQKVQLHSSLWQVPENLSGAERRMGLQLRGKTFWWHLCCYYYLNQLILVSANVTERVHEQRTIPMVIYVELISIFLADFFLHCAPIHVCLVWGFFWIFWVLFAILQMNWWFSTFSKLQFPLLQTKIHHFLLLGTSQVIPSGRIWWEQGSCDLCLPTPPPLAPTQRMRNSDLSFGQGRVPACPLPATSCASSYPGRGWLIQR